MYISFTGRYALSRTGGKQGSRVPLTLIKEKAGQKTGKLKNACKQQKWMVQCEQKITYLNTPISLIRIQMRNSSGGRKRVGGSLSIVRFHSHRKGSAQAEPARSRRSASSRTQEEFVIFRERTSRYVRPAFRNS